MTTKEEMKTLATKAELKVEQDKRVKLQTYDLSLFIGQSCFLNDGAKLYLILQPLYFNTSTSLKRLGDTEKVVSWKSIEIQISVLISKVSCLKQRNIDFSPPNRISVFTVYELDARSRYLNSDFNLKDCFFGGVNAEPDKCSDSRYGTDLHSLSLYLLSNFDCGENVIIFGVDMISSVHIGNKKKDVSILDKVPTQGLGDTTLTAEGKHSINF